VLDKEELSVHGVCIVVAADCVVGAFVMMLDGLATMVGAPTTILDWLG
jgi:hypothetical protein